MTWDETLQPADDTSSLAVDELPPMISAFELQSKPFPPPSWLVQDLIPDGLTLFAGKPKLGKSWLALQIGYAVATGGHLLGRSVSSGSVLYATLEDNERRVKARLSKITNEDETWPECLRFATLWPRLDQGGLELFERWLRSTPDARLLIVDTLATVRPNASGKESLYQADDAAIRGLHHLASEYDVCIIVVHHVRKMDSDDPFDTVSGSTGLTGAADTTVILKRGSEGTTLYGRGRDVTEFERAVEFNAESCLWSDLCRPEDVHGSQTKQAIRKVMQEGKQTPKEIAEAATIDYDLCAKTLQRMVKGGQIEKSKRGEYQLISDPLAS